MNSRFWARLPLLKKGRRGKTGVAEKTFKIKRLEEGGEEENQGKQRNYLGRADGVIRLGDGVMETAVGAIRVLSGAVMVVMDKTLGRTRQDEKDGHGKGEEKHPFPKNGCPGLFTGKI